jgi:hypothetical protein
MTEPITWHKPDDPPQYNIPVLVINESRFDCKPSIAVGVWSKKYNLWVYYPGIYGDDRVDFMPDVLAWATITAPDWVIEKYAEGKQ